MDFFCIVTSFDSPLLHTGLSLKKRFWLVVPPWVYLMLSSVSGFSYNGFIYKCGSTLNLVDAVFCHYFSLQSVGELCYGMNGPARPKLHHGPTGNRH